MSAPLKIEISGPGLPVDFLMEPERAKLWPGRRKERPSRMFISRKKWRFVPR
jgi:hypothetical protein